MSKKTDWVALVTFEDHDREVVYSGSKEDLTKKIHEKFSDVLDENERIFLKKWDNGWKSFVDLTNTNQIPSKSKIKVIRSSDEEKNQVAGSRPAVDQTNMEDLKLMAGCETCFEKPHSLKKNVGEGQGAIAPGNCFWDKITLKVCFLNSIPKQWKYEGVNITVSGDEIPHIISTTDILILANKWNSALPGSIPKEHRECVPTFQAVDNPDQADIRVWFTAKEDEGSRTYLGTRATSVEPGKQDSNLTMRLNLTGPDSYKEHLVIHEFGHALGLGHEHQRPKFWNAIRKFLKEGEVKDFFNSFTNFEVDAASYGDVEGLRSEEYDPDSIMHYWFRQCWLEEPYNSPQKVEDLAQNGDITEEEKKILTGYFKRTEDKGLATKLSKIDLQFIAGAYYKKRTGDGSAQPSVLPADNVTGGGVGDRTKHADEKQKALEEARKKKNELTQGAQPHYTDILTKSRMITALKDLHARPYNTIQVWATTAQTICVGFVAVIAVAILAVVAYK